MRSGRHLVLGGRSGGPVGVDSRGRLLLPRGVRAVLGLEDAAGISWCAGWLVVLSTGPIDEALAGVLR